MTELYIILEALDIAADAMEVQSDTSKENGYLNDSKQEALKAQNYRELKRSLVNDKVIMVKSEDMS